MRLFSSLLLAAVIAAAGPVEFGQTELDSAMAQRQLKWKTQAELSLDAPETFRIEPYAAGGAHITGGDLRGLMYGLLEAAEQIRSAGHFTKTSGTPAASLRGVRIVLNPELEQAPEEFWNSYFRMLARNRFNRVHVVFARIEAPYRLPQFLSRDAADYGIDFTLGIGSDISAVELARVLFVCPSIRAVAAEEGATQASVLSALRVAGRRVALDSDSAVATPSAPAGPSAAAEPALLREALASGVPVLRPVVSWPPSFEVSPPVEVPNAEAHALFYQVTGRLSYDAKSQLKDLSDPSLSRAAREIALWSAAAQQLKHGGSDYVASAEEAARNRAEHIASAKFTPAEIAERLDAAAAQLDQTTDADLRLLAGIAREHAAQQRTAANLPPVAKATRPNGWTHTAPESTPSDQPLTLILRMAQPKTASALRLHYRPADPAAVTHTIEMPSKNEVTFTIPPREITGNWDLQYYFEILYADGTGWFEPDPLAARPYWVVHVISPHTGGN